MAIVSHAREDRTWTQSRSPMTDGDHHRIKHDVGGRLTWEQSFSRKVMGSEPGAFTVLVAPFTSRPSELRCKVGMSLAMRSITFRASALSAVTAALSRTEALARYRVCGGVRLPDRLDVAGGEVLELLLHGFVLFLLPFSGISVQTGWAAPMLVVGAIAAKITDMVMAACTARPGAWRRSCDRRNRGRKSWMISLVASRRPQASVQFK